MIRAAQRIGAALLVVLYALSSLAWGGAGRGWAALEDASSFVIRDDLGRDVAIPGRVERIVSLQPEASRILAALGSVDRLVGLDYFLAKYDHVFPIIVPGLKDIPVVAYEDASANMEAIIRLNPDVILASPSDPHVPDALQSKVGKPVVAVSSLGHFDKLLEEIRLIGRVVGRSSRAEELIAYFRETLDLLDKPLRGVPPADRPRAYLAFWSSLVRTPSSYDPVAAAGGRNIAEGLASVQKGSDTVVVSLERILDWNPDIILVHGNFAPPERAVTVDGVLGDTRLRSVKAVRDKRVFYTFGFWYWWDPAQVLVETLYLAKLFHPTLFQGLDLEREGNRIYKKVYGIENGYSALCRSIQCDEWLKN